MDYLLRDSRECGVVYGIFDATRIQDSLALYHDSTDGCFHLAITLSGLAAFEDYLRARHSMYLQLYFHKTSVAAEAMMASRSARLGGFVLPADPDKYADLDEYNIEGALLEAAKALPSERERAAFRTLLRDLLRDRRLWKRVFEVSAKDRDSGQALVSEACRLLDNAGIAYEKVSSASSLTTFHGRLENEASRNYLRLIRKDETQFPRVVPIEDHSSLINNSERVHISRIYVEDRTTANGESLPKVVKELLTEKLTRLG
jgi:HD superfamily phosphohydrolase